MGCYGNAASARKEPGEGVGGGVGGGGEAGRWLVITRFKSNVWNFIFLGLPAIKYRWKMLTMGSGM